MRFRPIAMAGLAALAASLPMQARALDATADVGYTAEYTSNTARREDDEIDEWIHIPSAALTLSQESAALELDAAYRYERRIHDRDVFDDENAITGSASAIWHPLPERLDLHVSNTRTESTLRSFDPATEANRQEVSVTEGGPTLRLQPAGNAELSLGYVYSDVRSERTETDSTGHRGTLSYRVALSAVRTITFAGSYSEVEYDDPFAPELDVTIGTVTWAERGRQLDYSLTGGYNRTQRDQGRDTVDGPVLAVQAAWSAASNALFTIEAGRQITDRSRNLLTGRGAGRNRVDEDTDLNEVFTETYGGITVGRPLGNNQVALSLRGDREDYEDGDRDNERYVAAVTLTRELNRLTSFAASIEAGRRKFEDIDRDQDEYRGEIRLTRRLRGRLSVSISGAYEEWDADGGGRSFDEWIGRITLGYRLLDRARGL